MPTREAHVFPTQDHITFAAADISHGVQARRHRPILGWTFDDIEDALKQASLAVLAVELLLHRRSEAQRGGTITWSGRLALDMSWSMTARCVLHSQQQKTLLAAKNCEYRLPIARGYIYRRTSTSLLTCVLSTAPTIVSCALTRLFAGADEIEMGTDTA